MTSIDHEACDAAAFRFAMAKAATGVGIVTTAGPAGRAGRTVSSMTSLSLDPPSLLFCLHGGSPCTRIVRENGVFCLNLLSNEQFPIADRFAGRPRSGEAHAFVDDWDFDELCPRLRGSVASFTCRVLSAETVGTHTIFVGAALKAWTTSNPPLVYADRRYAMHAPLLPA